MYVLLPTRYWCCGDFWVISEVTKLLPSPKFHSQVFKSFSGSVDESIKLTVCNVCGFTGLKEKSATGGWFTIVIVCVLSRLMPSLLSVTINLALKIPVLIYICEKLH